MPEISLIPFETLIWLNQAANVGCSEAIVLRHVLKRIESLESDWAKELQANHAYNEATVEAIMQRLEKLEAPERQLHQDKLERLKALSQDDDCSNPEAAALAAPLPTHDLSNAAPLLWVLHHHLGSCSPVGQPIREYLGMGKFEVMSEAQIEAANQYRALSPERIFTAAAPPTPPITPAGGLVERVASYCQDDQVFARAAIHEVAEWLELEGYSRAASDLREELLE